jgi:hypothetical protein
MWKEAVVIIFEPFVLNVTGGTENNHERPPSEYPAFQPTCGSYTSGIQSKLGNDPIVWRCAAW